jgi:secreted Zn-dependent insulinase-like peptidase
MEQEKIARAAIDMLYNILDTGALLKVEEAQLIDLERRLNETIKNKEKDQAIKRIIARAAATAFAKDYCCDEILELFPKDSCEVAWRELDKVFTNVFGMTMEAAEL